MTPLGKWSTGIHHLQAVLKWPNNSLDVGQMQINAPTLDVNKIFHLSRASLRKSVDVH